MFGIVLLMSTFIALADARIYERCELARDLLKLGVNKEHVATWVCIAFHESRFDTSARNPHSGDHGLLQISELYWCGPGKACGVPCSAFRNDDISDDVQCALKIHKEHTRLQGNGFLAWVVYPHHCKHNAKKYLADCDAAVKNSLTKFDDRSRYLKSFERNATNPQYKYYPNIDSLKPNYLAISELFKGSYVNQFEENYYNNKAPVNWINFKIDNIDKLKLPNSKLPHRNGNFGFTTPSTTTTTIDPALIGIKPPSPRRIESNQFRRRMMNLVSIPTKNYDKNDNVPRKTIAEVPPRNKMYEEIDLSHNPFINLHKISAKTSTEAPQRSRGLSRYTPNYINAFAITTPKTVTSITSASTSSEKTTVIEKQSDNDYINNLSTTLRTITNITTSTTSENTLSVMNQSDSSYTPSPNIMTSRRGKSRYVPENYYDYTRTQRPNTLPITTSTSSTTVSIISSTTSSPSTTVSAPFTTTSTPYIDQSKVEMTTRMNDLKVTANSSKDNNQYNIGLSETTTQASYIISDNAKSAAVVEVKSASSLAESSSDITQNYETTPKPITTSTQSEMPRSSRFNWDSWHNIHLTTSRSQTTASPSFTATTLAPTSQKLIPSTQLTTAITQNASTSTEPTPTTKTTTWSIFDLYLNPTKATIRPFRFTPFENGPFKLRIFSGGTTTPPPSFFALKKHTR